MYFQRGSVLNHNMNGRGKMPVSKGMKMHMINWIDAPDDVYFVATDATRYYKFVFSILNLSVLFFFFLNSSTEH